MVIFLCFKPLINCTDDVHKCSADFRHFLAGWVHYTREMLPMYAPTINSYKRFKSGTWAPVATAWSIDNRTTGKKRKEEKKREKGS